MMCIGVHSYIPDNFLLYGAAALLLVIGFIYNFVKYHIILIH
jgi:hypothetical protein